MIAPKRFDFLCELLVMLIPVLIIMTGGPTIMVGIMQGAGVPPDVAIRFVSLLPWWLPIPAALLAWVSGKFLMMCFPTLQLPTTANTAQIEAAVQAALAKRESQPPVIVQSPPPVIVAPPAAPTVPPVS